MIMKLIRINGGGGNSRLFLGCPEIESQEDPGFPGSMRLESNEISNNDSAYDYDIDSNQWGGGL